uniref:transposase n=1 Tax=Limnohabitans sp. TaxID=1907725 RepID=UPI004047829D
RIKEQMMLFADRVSAHRWWANQWRILLSALAYTLMVVVRVTKTEPLRKLGMESAADTSHRAYAGL